MLAYVVFNGTVRTLAKNIFQLICRGIAVLYTTVDPIGILKNNLDDMKKEFRNLLQTIQRFSGSDQKLKDKIKDKIESTDPEHPGIKFLLAQADECDRVLTTKSDPLDAAALYHGDVVEIKEEPGIWTVNQISPFGGLAIPEERICVPHRLGTLVSLYREYVLGDQ